MENIDVGKLESLIAIMHESDLKGELTDIDYDELHIMKDKLKEYYERESRQTNE